MSMNEEEFQNYGAMRQGASRRSRGSALLAAMAGFAVVLTAIVLLVGGKVNFNQIFSHVGPSSIVGEQAVHERGLGPRCWGPGCIGGAFSPSFPVPLCGGPCRGNGGVGRGCGRCTPGGKMVRSCWPVDRR